MKKYDAETIEHIMDHIEVLLTKESEDKEFWRTSVDEERISQYGHSNEELYNNHFQQAFGAELALGQLLDELADLRNAIDIVKRF